MVRAKELGHLDGEFSRSSERAQPFTAVTNGRKEGSHIVRVNSSRDIIRLCLQHTEMISLPCGLPWPESNLPIEVMATYVKIHSCYVLELDNGCVCLQDFYNITEAWVVCKIGAD